MGDEYHRLVIVGEAARAVIVDGGTGSRSIGAVVAHKVVVAREVVDGGGEAYGGAVVRTVIGSQNIVMRAGRQSDHTR